MSQSTILDCLIIFGYSTTVSEKNCKEGKKKNDEVVDEEEREGESGRGRKRHA